MTKVGRGFLLGMAIEIVVLGDDRKTYLKSGLSHLILWTVVDLLFTLIIRAILLL